MITRRWFECPPSIDVPSAIEIPSDGPRGAALSTTHTSAVADSAAVQIVTAPVVAVRPDAFAGDQGTRLVGYVTVSLTDDEASGYTVAEHVHTVVEHAPGLLRVDLVHVDLERLIDRYHERQDDAGRLARRLQREMASLWVFLREHGVEPLAQLDLHVRLLQLVA